ncbi:hypothetical protein HCB33_06840 [Listeria sp. FSL L7-0233]|uniref:restriction endonuclease subunit S n=1 Tax=Listeria cossartiae TaxID=2838249 RepID=UPI0016237E14|nr:restriction endonuclease subunit S [Listeria cossartiae]MBC2183070.1 hypothetical protein [Listeria cossartiae subsp. cossartiae]
MEKFKLCELFEKPLSGEWGTELEEGKTGVPVIRTTNFGKNGKLDLRELVYREIDLEKKSNKVLLPGDIIIEKSGGGPKQPVGRVMYFDIEFERFVTNNFTAILRPVECIDSKFAYYLLNHLYSSGVVLRFQNKTTGIINLKLNDYLDSTVVALPSILNQKRISGSLDLSSRLIEKRKQQLVEMDNLIQSIFIEMFGDPNILKDSTRVNLKKVARITTGNTPPRKQEENYGDFIEWIKTDNIYSDRIYPAVAVEYLSREGAEKGRIVDSNSLLMACIAGSKISIGKLCLLDRQVAFNQQINAITCKKNVEPKYLYYVLKFSKDRLEKYASDSMKKMISKSKLENFEISIEDVKSQKDFLLIVQEIEAQKKLMEKSLIEMENNFNALMQKAFKGESFPE